MIDLNATSRASAATAAVRAAVTASALGSHPSRSDNQRLAVRTKTDDAACARTSSQSAGSERLEDEKHVPMSVRRASKPSRSRARTSPSLNAWTWSSTTSACDRSTRAATELEELEVFTHLPVGDVLTAIRFGLLEPGDLASLVHHDEVHERLAERPAVERVLLERIGGVLERGGKDRGVLRVGVRLDDRRRRQPAADAIEPRG